MRPNHSNDLNTRIRTRFCRAQALHLAGLLLLATAGIALEGPVAVSPGSSRGPGIAIADRCPTFSWAGVDRAQAYELTVYRVGEKGLEARPVFTQKIEGTASSWSPSLAQCLQSDGSYAWSVRATGEEGVSEWSKPSLFEVVGVPGEAEPKNPPIRTAMAAASAAESAGPAQRAQTNEKTAPGSSELPGPLAFPPGTPTVIDADGIVKAVAFEGDGSLLTDLDPAALTPGITGAHVLDGTLSGVDIADGSLSGTDIVDGSIAGIDITDGTLTGADILDGSLTAADIADGSGSGLDADTVDGFHASGAATPNTLLALDGSGDLPANAATATLAAAATALAADGTDCAADEAAGGVDAAGNAEECRDQADLTAFGTLNTRVGSGALSANTTGNQNTAVGSKALNSNTTGNSNTATGQNALYSNVGGIQNSATGARALQNNSTGSTNTADGYSALKTNSTGTENTAVGASALLSSETGGRNTATGSGALQSNTTGSDNTAVGRAALFLNTIGVRNTAVGKDAGVYATTGSDNIFIANDGMAGDDKKIKIGTQGTQTATYVAGIHAVTPGGATQAVVIDASGQLGSTAGGAGSGIDADTLDGKQAEDFIEETELASLGDLNTQLGTTIADGPHTVAHGDGTDCAADEAAGGVDASGNAEECRDQANLTAFGTFNTRVGKDALAANTTGNANTAVGYGALASNTTASYNFAVGERSLTANTTGSSNTAAGTGALASNTTGGSNTAVGTDSLAYNTTGTRNTATGLDALRANTTGFDNTASGHSALKSNTTADYNTATGVEALQYNTTGERNTASGFRALRDNTTGYRNTASGNGALQNNTEGYRNTANGSLALSANTTGSYNTASGVKALQYLSTGSNNTAVGSLALSTNVATSSNTAVGRAALLNVTGGGENSALGRNALSNLTSGYRNVAVGYKAGYNATVGSSNIFVLNDGVAGDTTTTRIGAVQTKTYVAGIRGATTGIADAISVVIDSAGQLGTISSSRRYKEDVADMAEASEALLELRPVTFRYKKEYADGDKPIQFGLIAEEVAEIFPELVVYNADGEPETVKYHLLSSLLLNELQKLSSESAAQAAINAAQTQFNAAQRQTIAAQAAEIERLRASSDRLVAMGARLRELEPLEARLQRLEAMLGGETRLTASERKPPPVRPGAR